MLTYDEIKSLIILVFWMAVLWRAVDSFFVGVLRGVLKRADKVSSKETQEEPQHKNREPDQQEKPRTKGPIGFKSDY